MIKSLCDKQLIEKGISSNESAYALEFCRRHNLQPTIEMQEVLKRWRKLKYPSVTAAKKTIS
jgi:hypothetical protein